jgi:hypothetical protein
MISAGTLRPAVDATYSVINRPRGCDGPSVAVLAAAVTVAMAISFA